MSSDNCNNSNITSLFIDLSTYDQAEKYMYGGEKSTSYFVADVKKATWFAQIPVVLQRCSGCPGFGDEFSVSVSRAGDYLLDTWLRITTPCISVVSGVVAGDRDLTSGQLERKLCLPLAGKIKVGWTPNLMHNLIVEACITFNDLVAARFDKFFLDFWASFTVPASKKAGYNTMIGNISELVVPSNTLPSRILNLPLPFFFSRDSGVALPTAALPYNDIRISLTFEKLENLLIQYQPCVTNANVVRYQWLRPRNYVFRLDWKCVNQSASFMWKDA